ncbi:MAG: hypothetical protein KKA62_02690 [Nanoarchaeota archaeon]|nr:hypothetical protein [Nanoarchaeota archaeon]MBU1644545.1 hypothetical protein [Nanoarchaeota archaeon]MBU1976838.1 hypothetical protein [Nanoarchaeota archaeon]
MNKFWEKVEHYNAKLIPFAVVALLLIILFELFLHIENHIIELIVHIIDYLVITIFIIDLVFLAIKSKGARFFFKHYWLDIVAIFPFIIFFNIISYTYRTIIAAERFVLGQSILHESLEASKFFKLFSQGGSKLAKVLKIAARIIRIITKTRLFTKIEHHKKRHQHLNKSKIKKSRKSKTKRKKR